MLIEINIQNETVTINGNTCNFYEAGLCENTQDAEPLTDSDEIREVLRDKYEGQEIEVVFEKPFFTNPETYTEAIVDGELWVYGAAVTDITEETPRMHIGRDRSWGQGDEKETELPTTSESGDIEWRFAKYCELHPSELQGTEAESKIRRFYHFNA